MSAQQTNGIVVGVDGFTLLAYGSRMGRARRRCATLRSRECGSCPGNNRRKGGHLVTAVSKL